MRRGGPRYTEVEAREAIAASDCWAEALRRLGIRAAGGHHKTIQKWARTWGISTEHFDANGARARQGRGRAVPLDTILVDHSTYSRGHLKKRPLDGGVKAAACELCGQGEVWRGRRMALILDHNRLENLRIVCPNCAATFDTHCGRNKELVDRACVTCQTTFMPRYGGQRFCSRACSAPARSEALRGVPQPERRKVSRPPYEALLAEIAATSYLAVGKRYGVSDNAVRKRVRQYERERAAAGAQDPAAATLRA